MENNLACPYFVPCEIVYDISWPHPARLPLGAGWRGSCCAGNGAKPEHESTPDAALLRDNCNLGYATTCPHLPPARDWDAIRFSIASSTAGQITLCYVCELAHAPKAHGTLAYNLATESWQDSATDPRVRRLAESFLHAYRIRQSPSLISQNYD